MKYAVITLVITLLAISGIAFAEEPERVGVYDSRAIAIAWAGTEPFITELKDLKTRNNEATEAGDTELAEKLEAEGKAMQEKLHFQGFSTAPVDNILAQFQESITAAMEEAGVTVIVSKWDKEGLARYPDVEQVDVTMELVLAMGTNEKQLGFLQNIGDKPPVPMEELKKMLAEGHE